MKANAKEVFIRVGSCLKGDFWLPAGSVSPDSRSLYDSYNHGWNMLAVGGWGGLACLVLSRLVHQGSWSSYQPGPPRGFTSTHQVSDFGLDPKRLDLLYQGPQGGYLLALAQDPPARAPQPASEHARLTLSVAFADNSAERVAIYANQVARRLSMCPLPVNLDGQTVNSGQFLELKNVANTTGDGEVCPPPPCSAWKLEEPGRVPAWCKPTPSRRAATGGVGKGRPNAGVLQSQLLGCRSYFQRTREARSTLFVVQRGCRLQGVELPKVPRGWWVALAADFLKTDLSGSNLVADASPEQTWNG